MPLLGRIPLCGVLFVPSLLGHPPSCNGHSRLTSRPPGRPLLDGVLPGDPPACPAHPPARLPAHGFVKEVYCHVIASPVFKRLRLLQTSNEVNVLVTLHLACSERGTSYTSGGQGIRKGPESQGRISSGLCR